MEIVLIGMGSGANTLTADAHNALLAADCVLGAERLLGKLPEDCTQNRIKAVRTEELIKLLSCGNWEHAAVVFSGDTGFYSGAVALAAALEEKGLEFRVLAGISSVQMLAARLKRPWQDWTLVSAHGRACDPVAEVLRGKPTFFLTGGKQTPAALCAELSGAGLGFLSAAVGENLGTAAERVCTGTAAELAAQSFAPLSVLWVEALALPKRRAGGYPDDAFLRADGVPMTKRFVRTAILSLLAPTEGETVWDVGAGTGSVGIELAAAAEGSPVYAIEQSPQAAALLRRNAKKFGAYNLRIVQGRAPEALEPLPAPDAVFIGGSTGNMAAIIAAALHKNPRARLCASAVSPETVTAALDAMQSHGRNPQLVQLSVSTSKSAGDYHLMLAQNPITLIYSVETELPNA